MNPFHSCLRAAELMSQALDEPLDLVDQMRLRMHLKLCGNCRNVEQQLETLHLLAPGLGMLDENGAPSTHTDLPPPGS